LSPRSLPRRFAVALGAASLGALGGLTLGQQSLPSGSKLIPMYGAAGALIALLSLRLLGLLRMIWSDFFGKDEGLR
jgi:hypothetical protein